jgi:hypothetical protein
MVVLHLHNTHSVFLDPFNYEPVVSGKCYRVFSGSIPFQGMQPQSPMSIQLGKFVRGSENCQPLNILPPNRY